MSSLPARHPTTAPGIRRYLTCPAWQAQTRTTGDTYQVTTPAPRGFINPDARPDYHGQPLLLPTWQVDRFTPEALTEMCRANGMSWMEVRP